MRHSITAGNGRFSGYVEPSNAYEAGAFLCVNASAFHFTRDETLALAAALTAIADPKPDAVGDVVGVTAYVTGDSDKWNHGFEAGTPVTIVLDDSEHDGSYLAEGPTGTEYVGANDLSIFAPRVCFGECGCSA